MRIQVRDVLGFGHSHHGGSYGTLSTCTALLQVLNYWTSKAPLFKAASIGIAIIEVGGGLLV